MADGRAKTEADGGTGWVAILAWGWVALLALVVVAEVFGLLDLRLALDLQRHLH